MTIVLGCRVDNVLPDRDHFPQAPTGCRDREHASRSGMIGVLRLLAFRAPIIPGQEVPVTSVPRARWRLMTTMGRQFVGQKRSYGAINAERVSDVAPAL